MIMEANRFLKVFFSLAESVVMDLEVDPGSWLGDLTIFILRLHKNGDLTSPVTILDYV